MNESTLQPIAPVGIRVREMAPEQLEEFGVAISQQFAGRLEDARQELIEAMKLVGRSDYRDLHVEAGELVNRLDGLRLKLVERGGIDHG